MAKILFEETTEPGDAVAGNLWMYADQADGHVKIKHSDGSVLDLSSTVAGSTAWGTIIGDITQQGDLQGALDAKGSKTAVDANVAAIAALSTPKSSLVAEGSIPNVKLEVEDGGTAGLFQIYDMASPVHVVSGIQWLASTQEADWTLSDKDTGVTRALFQMKPDGTFWIGNGMTQEQIAVAGDVPPDSFNVGDKHDVSHLSNLNDVGAYFVTNDNAPDFPQGVHVGVLNVIHYDYLNEKVQRLTDESTYRVYERWYVNNSWGDALDWKETSASKQITKLSTDMLGKASKASQPQVFSGSTIPSDDLGKNYDRYHQYEAGSIITEDLSHGSSRDSYSPMFFALFSEYEGDIVDPTNAIYQIDVAPSSKEIYIDFIGDTKAIEEARLFIINPKDSPTEVEVPLTIEFNSADEIVFQYQSASDSIMRGILGDGSGVEQSSYRFEIVVGVTTAKEQNWEKHDHHWEKDDFLNVDEINELIRSYNTIVIQPLGDPKRPTRAESIIAFKTLPNMDWSQNDTFYIRDSGGGNKMVFCTYIADGATDEASAGSFFFKDMTECV